MPPYVSGAWTACHSPWYKAIPPISTAGKRHATQSFMTSSVTYLAVVREAAQGGDVLDRKVSLRRRRGPVALLSDPVDLLVEL